MPDPVTADREWRGLYLAGGISAWLYVVLAVVVPGAMTMAVDGFWDIIVDGRRLLEFISDGHEVYWHLVQALVLMSSIFLVVTFTAATVALFRAARVPALLGGVVGVVSQVLFMAYYPVLLGMVHLAGEYEGATEARQDELATAVEALIAQNSGFNPVYEAMMGAGALLLSLAMLKAAFRRSTAYVGIAGFVAVVGGLVLYPVIGIGYFAWWAVFVLWLLLVGWELVRAGADTSSAPARE